MVGVGVFVDERQVRLV